MKSSKLFVSSLLVSALTLSGCATVAGESEEASDRAGRSGDVATPESDEAIGEAAGQVVGSPYESAWSPYGAVPNAFAKASPAVAPYQDRLYMSHLDSTAGGLYWSWFSGAEWVQPIALADYHTTFYPALASWGDRLNLAYVDESTSRIHLATYDGTAWGAAVDTGLAGTAAPAMAYYNSTAYLFNLSAEREIVYSTYAGGGWSPYVGTGIYSRSIPAVAAYGDKLHMLHQGVYSSRLGWATFDGATWAPEPAFLPVRLADGTPSFGVHGDQLHYMYRSLSGKQVLWGAYDGASWSDYGVLPTAYGPYGAPGLASLSDDFFMVNPVGENTPINFYRYQPVAP